MSLTIEPVSDLALVPLVLSESIEESLILTLLDVANHLEKNSEAMAAQEGLTTQQWLVLLQIAGDPNFPAMHSKGNPREGRTEGVLASEIAAARGVSRANVSTMVTPLLRRKLIRQADDPSDRRRKLLTLAPAGRRIIERLEPLRRGANQKFFADLEPEVKKELLHNLERCLEELNRLSKRRGKLATTRHRSRS